MRACCVPLCKSRYGNNAKVQGITFHEFPVNEQLRQKWILNIMRKDGKTNELWNPTDASVICSLHFEEHCITRTKKTNIVTGSVPTVFSDYPARIRKLMTHCINKRFDNRPSNSPRLSNTSSNKRVDRCNRTNNSTSVRHGKSIVQDTKNVENTDRNKAAISSLISSEHDYCPKRLLTDANLSIESEEMFVSFLTQDSESGDEMLSNCKTSSFTPAEEKMRTVQVEENVKMGLKRIDAHVDSSPQQDSTHKISSPVQSLPLMKKRSKFSNKSLDNYKAKYEITQRQVKSLKTKLAEMEDELKRVKAENVSLELHVKYLQLKK